MAAGQQNNISVGGIIQARISSERLPGKVLMPLPYPQGKPLLQWTIDSAKKSRFLNKIIVATSEKSENNIIENFSAEQRILCFRGDEENVLSRFIRLTEEHKFDVVVRLTADNPFLDVSLLDETILTHINNKNDYTSSYGLPLGMNFEIISGKALLSLKNYQLTSQDCEHVTPFILRNEFFKKEKLEIYTKGFENLRLTIDYPSDFALASIIAGLINEGTNSVMEQIKSIYRNTSWIFEINNSSLQKRVFEDTKDEVIYASEVLKKLDLHFASAIMIKQVDKIQGSL